jgi:hypothetical protein
MCGPGRNNPLSHRDRTPHATVTKYFYDLFILCGRYQNGTRSMVKNVIFDLGGVVIEWNPDRILDAYYTDPDVRALMKQQMLQHPDWLELDRGTVAHPDRDRRVAGKAARARGVPLYC